MSYLQWLCVLPHVGATERPYGDNMETTGAVIGQFGLLVFSDAGGGEERLFSLTRIEQKHLLGEPAAHWAQLSVSVFTLVIQIWVLFWFWSYSGSSVYMGHEEPVSAASRFQIVCLRVSLDFSVMMFCTNKDCLETWIRGSVTVRMSVLLQLQIETCNRTHVNPSRWAFIRLKSAWTRQLPWLCLFQPSPPLCRLLYLYEALQSLPPPPVHQVPSDLPTPVTWLPHPPAHLCLILQSLCQYLDQSDCQCCFVPLLCSLLNLNLNLNLNLFGFAAFACKLKCHHIIIIIRVAASQGIQN